MLSKFFVSDGRVRALRAGPAGGLLDGFADALRQAGYARITARGTCVQRSTLSLVPTGRASRLEV